MRKPAFCIFLWPLYSDIIFLIDHYCVGYQLSIAYCLFFISSPEPLGSQGELIVYRTDPKFSDR